MASVIELAGVQDMTLRDFIRLFRVDPDLSLTFERVRTLGYAPLEPSTVRIALHPTDEDGDMTLRIEAH